MLSCNCRGSAAISSFHQKRQTHSSSLVLSHCKHVLFQQCIVRGCMQGCLYTCIYKHFTVCTRYSIVVDMDLLQAQKVSSKQTSNGSSSSIKTNRRVFTLRLILLLVFQILKIKISFKQEMPTSKPFNNMVRTRSSYVAFLKRLKLKSFCL